MERQDSVQRFLELIRRSHRGKFKVYIGMSAGVGKTCRMLQEARQLLDAGVDVRIGYIETHGRAGTEALVEGLPLVPRRRLFYKGKELEEMDTQAIVNLRPEIVVVDELAHTNIEGSENPKRWQDVMQILDAGISVISAVNIQHIEGLNEVVEEITGIEIRERVPDSVLAMADEVVNIDLTADELIDRLKAGKIYKPDKVAAALNNFFTQENILQLRELALKEVALRVEKKVDSEVTGSETFRRDKLLAVIDSSEKRARRVIRKTARMATHLNAAFTVLYVQGDREADDFLRRQSARQRSEQEVQPEVQYVQRVEAGSSTEALERELVKYLLKYGHCSFDFKEGRNMVPCNVAEVIFAELDADNLSFRNPLYNQILATYREHWQELGTGVEVPVHYFLNHPDPEVCNASVDILTSDDNYVASELWKRKEVHVESEAEMLAVGVPKAVMLYKSKVIDGFIKELRAQLEKGDLSEDETSEIMQRMTRLNAARVSISHKLQRTIL